MSLYAAIAGVTVTHAILLNVTNPGTSDHHHFPSGPLTPPLLDSIRSAASTIAYGMMTYYTGNQTGKEPGLLPAPYYWWEAGAMWGGMVEYWHYTGDTSYNDVVAQAILAQASPTDDFMMPEETNQLVYTLILRVMQESIGTMTELMVCMRRATTTKPSGASPP